MLNELIADTPTSELGRARARCEIELEDELASTPAE
jgi:hypothetical protein